MLTKRTALILVAWVCWRAWCSDHRLDAAFNRYFASRDCAEAWQRCQNILAQHDSNALARFRVDGCSAAFVAYSQRAQLQLRLGAADRALADGTQALAHAGTAASRERLMWCVYTCAVAQDMMTNVHRASNPYWQWLRAFADDNDTMRGVLALRDAQALLHTHATTDAERVLATLMTRDRLLFPEAAMMHARLAHERGDGREAALRYLDCLRLHLWHQKGAVARSAMAALDSMLPHLADDLLAHYCGLRRTLPGRYPAMRRYADLIAGLRAAALDNPARNEQLLRHYQHERHGTDLCALTNFAARLHATGYDDALATYINHRTRTAVLIARHYHAHGAPEQGCSCLLQAFRFRTRVCTDSDGAAQLLTALNAHVSAMSSAQSNEYRQLLLQHLMYMDGIWTNRLRQATAARTHTAAQEAYVVRLRPVVVQAFECLPEQP